MSLSLLSAPRSVLMVCDEALYVYESTARNTRLVGVLEWSDPVLEDKIAHVLAKDCGGKSVLILNDMVEQHYRKERVPNVGLLDKSGVIQRKLKVSFPNYPVRAAYELKEKAPKEGGKGGSIHIFAAVPASDQYFKMIGGVRRSLCSVAGFGLLPVESSNLVQRLSDKLTPRGKKKSVWSLFIGQHRSGGLRQIVTKNGELALTRMTPITEKDSDPHDWAKDVYTEFKATMSYLARFGFNAEDGLDVITIANNQAGEILSDMIDVDCNFYPLGVKEAAALAGLQLGPQDDVRYADPLHIAWGARKTKLILPMKAKEVDQVSGPRQAAMLLTLLLIAGAAFQGYQALASFQEMQVVISDLDTARTQQNRLQREYDDEVAKKEALGFDVELVQAAVDVHQKLEENDIRNLNIMDAIGRALGRDLRLDQITVQQIEKSGVPDFMSRSVNDDGEELGEPHYSINFQLTFPSTTNIDRGNEEVSNLRDRLAQILPGHYVEVTKFLKDYEYVDDLVVETGGGTRKPEGQDFVVSILIEGPRV